MLVNISATAQIYWIFLCGSMTSHARSSGSAQYGSNHVTDNLENRLNCLVHSGSYQFLIVNFSFFINLIRALSPD